MMKRFYLYIFLFALCVQTYAQQMKKLSDVDTFKKKVEQTASSVKSIESDFTQIKHLDIFDDNITSKGKFYYKHSDKICLEYTTPAKYLIVINGEKLKIVSDGKKNVMSLNSNKVMKEMRGMLTACMSGNIAQVSGYQMDFFENTQQYLVKIKPTNKSVQEYISGFDIYFDKKDLSVTKLRISEAGNNYTDYLFANKKFNSLNDEKKFAVN